MSFLISDILHHSKIAKNCIDSFIKKEKFKKKKWNKQNLH